MKLLELLLESKSAPLYHGTTIARAEQILSSNTLHPTNYMRSRANQEAQIASLTRDPAIAKRFIKQHTKTPTHIEGVIFILDQLKLSNDLGRKLQPYDDFSLAMDAPARAMNRSEYEEAVIGGIPNFKKYIIKVVIFADKTEAPYYPNLFSLPHELHAPMITVRRDPQPNIITKRIDHRMPAMEATSYKPKAIARLWGGFNGRQIPKELVSFIGKHVKTSANGKQYVTRYEDKWYFNVFANNPKITDFDSFFKVISPYFTVQRLQEL